MPATEPSSSGCDLLPEPGELDQVGEADGDVGGAADLPRGEVGGADHVAADLLERVGAQGVDDGRLDQRHQVLGGAGEAEREVPLGVSRLHHRPHRQLPVGGGDPRGAGPDRPRHLDDPVLGQAGVEEVAHAIGRVELGLGQGLAVGIRVGDADRRRRPLEEVEVDAGELGDFARRVAGAVTGQRALDREQRQARRRDRLAELLQRDAFGAQPLEQLEPRRPGVALDAVEQPLCLEIDAHGTNTSRFARGAKNQICLIWLAPHS